MYGLLLSLCIGLSAILPLLDPSFGHVAINIGSTPSFALMLTITLLICLFWVARTWNAIAVAGIGFALVSNLPQSWLQWVQQFGIHGIHAYRYLIFAIICVPIGLIQLNRRAKFVTVSLPITIQIVLLITCLGGLIGINIPTTTLKINLDTKDIKAFTGRIIDVSAPSNYYLFPHALQHEILTTTSLIGADGLFYESSGHAPEIYSFKTALNPHTFIAGAPSSFFQSTGKTLEQQATASATLLGINYMIINGNQPLATPSSTIISAGTITDESTKKVQDYLYVVKLSDSALVESLSKIPTVNSAINLGTWWTTTDHQQLFVKNAIPQSILAPNQPISISNIRYDQTHIAFTIDSQTDVPVLIKFTYSPYWSAHGSTSQPQWITPGYMYLQGHGPITLTWQTPRYVIQSSIISIATLIGSCIYFITKKPRQ
jgi:hypothetical protein